MKRYVVILCCVAISLAVIIILVGCPSNTNTPTEPALVSVRVLGGMVEDCDTACANVSGVCDLPGLIELNDPSTCYTALVDAGMPADTFGPMPYGDEGGCHWGYDVEDDGDFYGYSGRGISVTCSSAIGPATRRMCACNVEQ